MPALKELWFSVCTRDSKFFSIISELKALTIVKKLQIKKLKTSPVNVCHCEEVSACTIMEFISDDEIIDNLFYEAACGLEQVDIILPPLCQINLHSTVKVPTATNLM